MVPRLALALAVVAVGARAPSFCGTVEGTVSLPRFTPKPPNQRYPGNRPPGEYLRGPAVVFVDVPGSEQSPQGKAVLEQRDRQFVPLALPIVKGTTVSFPNDDDEYHNVFSRSKTKELELGRYGKGDAREVTFDKPGLVRLRCEIHSNMHAAILVLESPFFAVADESGHFQIKDVPPGEYQAYAFQEDYEPADSKADPLRAIGKAVVVTGGAVTVDFDLGNE